MTDDKLVELVVRVYYSQWTLDDPDECLEGTNIKNWEIHKVPMQAAIEAYEQHLKDQGKVIVDVTKVKVMHKAAEQHARNLYVDASNQTGKKQERTSKHVKDIMSVLYQVEKMIEASEKG